MVPRTEYSVAALVHVKRDEFPSALRQVEEYRARKHEVKGHGAAVVEERASLMECSVRLQWAHELLEAGMGAEARRQVERAREAFAEASHNEKSVSLLLDLGRCHGALGDMERARRYLRAYLAQAPEGPEAEFARRALQWTRRPPPGR